jgi:hypothetical protein
MLIAGAALVAGLHPAAAQEDFQPVGNERDWYVYAEETGSGKMCWIASVPERWIARRGGRDVTSDVRRGEIRLMVANRPESGVTNEVSVVVGYPLRDGSAAQLEIGDDRFDMFTQGEMAWTEDAAADGRAIEAMRAGLEAKVTGTSSRGTTTIDTFSLLGFTAALEQARQLCQ